MPFHRGALDVDEKLYRRLGIHVSCEPKYERQRLYFK